jgi:hypothetical protein
MSAERADGAPAMPDGEAVKSETDLLFDRGYAIIEETRKLLAGFTMPTLGPAPTARRPARRKAARSATTEPA